MSESMVIKGIDPEDLPKIVAGLVKEGLTFEAGPDTAAPGDFKIILTGGY